MNDTFYNLLIEAAADGNTAEVARLTSNLSEPLDCGRAIRWAANNGRLNCLKILINVHNPLSDISPALYLAAGQGHLDCVSHLLPLVDPLYKNSAAMVEAAGNGHTECLLLLVDVSDCAQHGYTALLESAKNGHIECAQILVDNLPNKCLKDLRLYFSDRHLNLNIVDQLDAYAQRTRLMNEVGDVSTVQRRKI